MIKIRNFTELPHGSIEDKIWTMKEMEKQI